MWRSPFYSPKYSNLINFSMEEKEKIVAETQQQLLWGQPGESMSNENLKANPPTPFGLIFTRTKSIFRANEIIESEEFTLKMYRESFKFNIPMKLKKK